MVKFSVAISSVCLVVFVDAVFAFSAQTDLTLHGRGHYDNVITEVDSAAISRLVAEEIPKSVFAFDVRALKNLVREKPTENVFFSPMCVYHTLLMHFQALSQEKREALKDVLNITASIHGNDYESAFEDISKRIDHEYEKGLSHSRNSTSSGADISNAFFVQKDNSVMNGNYRSIHNRIYPHAMYMNVDFVGGSAEATSTINSFVAEHTDKHIDQFYTSHVSSDTPVVAVHTLNFHGVWEKTFPKEHTQTGKFHTGDGGVIDVPMMHNEEVVSYISSDILQLDAIELQYMGGEFSMYVVLPRHTQTISNMTEYGHWYDLHELRRNMRQLRVDYKIPKMKFTGSHSFVKTLELRDVLGGMEALHLVELDMNEQGTMAAAATAVGNKRPHVWSDTHGLNGHRISESSSTSEAQFYVDRPYLVAVVHKFTHMVLFQGVVHKPY